MTNHIAQLDAAFHALADPTRRAILARLAPGPASVGELKQPFRMALPTLLQHLRVLETSGLIATEKRGRVRICALKPDALRETETWLATQRSAWEARLDRLDSYVLQMEEKTDD